MPMKLEYAAYEWEDEKDFQELVEDKAWSPRNQDLVVIGIVVGNLETGEGCLYLDKEHDQSDLWLADVLKDADSDLERLYKEAARKAFG